MNTFVKNLQKKTETVFSQTYVFADTVMSLIFGGKKLISTNWFSLGVNPIWLIDFRAFLFTYVYTGQKLNT